MLPDELNYDIDDFKRMFKKKFDNFCKKAPILMSYIITDDKVTVYSYNDKKKSKRLFNYKLDFAKDVKENIYNIKKKLLNSYYPIMIETIERVSEYTPEELNEMVKQGEIDLNQIDTIKRVTYDSIEWRIEKVIVLRDELFIRNLLENRLYRFKTKVPVTLFLKKFRINFTPEEAWEYFMNKSFLKNEVMETYE